MLVIAGCIAILGCPFAYAIPARNEHKKEEKLTAKIAREKNPGKKARLQMKLAKIKLIEANEAYLKKDFAEGKSLLKEYLEQIKTSWVTLQNSKEPVKKHLNAYMTLEMSLDHDERFLKDLREGVPYPHSEFVKQIENESKMVHDQVLEALFPSGFLREPRTRSPKHTKRPAPAKAGAAKS